MHVIAASQQLCCCNWVDENRSVQQGTFEKSLLVIVDAGESEPAPLG
jgi:hypothetical protein